MKKICKALILVLVISFCILAPQTVKAAEKSSDGLYEFEGDYFNGTCTIKKYLGAYKGPEEEFVFPSEIDGLKVTEVQSYFGKTASGSPDFASITIPDTVKVVNITFYGKLEKLIIPDKLESIIFKGDAEDMMDELVLPASLKNIAISFPIKKITVEDGMTVIPGGAFKNCKRTEQVVLPASVKEVKDQSFYEMNALKLVNLENVEKIGINAFSYCSSLEEIRLNNENLVIGNSAFSSSGLKTVSITAKNLTIGDFWVFGTCPELEEIEISSPNVKIIKNIVPDCRSLRRVVLPPNVEYVYLGESGKSKVEELIIPSSCKTVDGLFKMGFDKFANIYFYNPNCEIGYYIGITFEQSAIIHGYKNSTAYNYAKEYGHKFVEIPGEPQIPTPSNNPSATPKPTTSPKPVATSLSGVSVSGRTVRVSWKKQSSNVTGYQVQYATDKKFSDAKTKTIKKNTTTSVKIKLKPGKKYYIRVRTYSSSNNTKKYSAWSKTKKVKTKK